MGGGSVMVNEASFETVLAKLRRADEHRKGFDRRVREFLDQNPYSVALDFEPDTGWHNLRWQVHLVPPAEDLALIFGDMLSNLRATLDYLVWQLVLRNGATPTRNTAFPVVKDAKDWDANRAGMLKGVADVWATEIQKLQPYYGGDRRDAHLLATLDYVNNVNKHRMLPTVIVNATRFGAWIEPGDAAGKEIEMKSYVDDPIDNGAYAFRFRVTETHQQLQVNMNEALPVRVSLRDCLTGWTNDQVFEWVAGAVAVFEPAFAG
jgi:hypothetical protein